MKTLSIQKIYYRRLTGNSIRSPRERFKKYYQDLCALENTPPIHPESYLCGSQYSYVALIDSLLPQIEKEGFLEKTELILMSFWSPEFDPDHASGAYLCHRYQYKGKIIDVGGCGFLAPFTALSLIQTYLTHSKIHNALLLCLDQSTIPHQKLNDVRFPNCASICALVLKQAVQKTGLQLIMSANIAHQALYPFLMKCFEKKQIDPLKSSLSINYDSSGLKKIDFKIRSIFKKIYYSFRQGNSVEKFCSLLDILNNQSEKLNRHQILLVQDLENDRFGVCIVKGKYFYDRP